MIKLLNKHYEVKCPEHEIANLQIAAAKLNEQMTAIKKKFRHLNEFQVLLLASLHVSHELVECLSQQEQEQWQVAEILKSLEKKSRSKTATNKVLEPESV